MNPPTTPPAYGASGHALTEPAPTTGPYPGPHAVDAVIQPCAHPGPCDTPTAVDLARRLEQANTALTRLRHLVREQLAGAIEQEDLDIHPANGILTVLGLPHLPRRWTVRLTLTVQVTVTADDQEQAFDTAAEITTDALTGVGVTTDHDRIEYDAAEAGDIALDEL